VPCPAPPAALGDLPMGSMLASVCNAAFIACFGMATTISSLTMKLLSFLPMSKKSHETASLFLCRWFWGTSLMFLPWVRRIKFEDGGYKELVDIIKKADIEVAAGKEKCKPVFSLGNHTSFLDIPLCVNALPFFIYMRGRTYMADHLLNLPVIGYMCKAIGHFPVHFSSDTDGVFKVNPEKMAVVEAKVDEFMDAGGFLSIYPEGQVNKNPDKILPFRYGGMKRALERDARIGLQVFYGNNKVWPAKAKMAGYPGTIVYGGRVVAPEGCVAYIKGLRDAGLPEDEKDLEDHALLAKRLQEIMQEMYDLYKSVAQGTNGTKHD